MLRIYSVVRHLMDRYDFSLLCFDRPEGEIVPACSIPVPPPEEVFSKIYTVPMRTAHIPDEAKPDLPPLARTWFSPEMASMVDRLTRTGAVDLLHIEFLQMAFYSWYRRDVPSVLTEHDVSHLSLFNSYFREWTGWQRLGRIGEWLHVRRYHKEICKTFNGIVTLTPGDFENLAQTVPEHQLAHVPTCVDLEAFPYRGDPGENTSGDLVYVGHYPHYPNEEAALWFCRSIFPQILKKRPNTKLFLVGSSPTEAIRKLASKNIVVTGTVPEVRPFLDRGSVFVAPIRLGYGIKGKVLEAYARGLPVVATSVVKKGIPESVVGEHLLVGDSPEEFATETLRLLEDEALRSRMAAKARELVEQHYSWSASVARLDGLYRRLLKLPEEETNLREAVMERG